MGKFAEIADVTGRYEDKDALPSSYSAAGGWIDLRIGDVESELMGQVPSLRKTVGQINADSAAAGDSDRISRVKTLVCEKVLDLLRSPGGRASLSTTTPDITISSSYGYVPDKTRGKIAFTPTELSSVKLRRRRSNFGTVPVKPWRPAHDLRY
ncbi:hypothetical protein ABW16_21545 [Mycolicibacter heraklionensis]|uniref:Uncharacterized protein n=2 Tax=Mycolicibacter heraklionensis TaxID=512402 RepID=A0ABR5FA24_9MYCO|nr:hypothetical protein ABW16_21545 [Mycolicibacter heraklionensis]